MLFLLWEIVQNLYQILLEVYLCQRWIVEFKGIMQLVLFMIFFSDFVTPQKRTEGCWLLPNSAQSWILS